MNQPAPYEFYPDDYRDLPEPYAFVSHESAVEAIWALAARNWQGILDDENVWLVPKAPICVTTQGDFKKLAESVDLHALGIKLRPAHLLVPDKSCYSRGKIARFHIWTDYFPIHSFVRIHDRVFVSTPHFAVLQLAMARRSGRLQSQAAEESAAEDARIRAMLGIEERTPTATELLRWENIANLVRAAQVLTDFMSTYRYVPNNGDSSYGIVYGEKPIVTPESFAAFLAEVGSSRGVERARWVAKAAFANAASPMETMIALLISIPKKLGGFGLPRPELNWEFCVDAEKRELSSQDSFVLDLCWPSKHLAVEYYGFNEHFAAGPHKVASDAARANSLTALGWTVLHVTYDQVKTLSSISLLAREIACILEVELATPTDLELIWRTRLLALLLPTERL